MKKKNLKTATGRVGLNEAPTLLSIEEVEANTAFAKFGADNREDYEQLIDGLTNFDLSNHAVAVGLRPVSERSRIRTALISAFEHAKAEVGNAPRIGVRGESTAVKNVIADNYEDFLKQFRPVGV